MSAPSSSGKLQRIFPLHLSPIEAFMHADDRPRIPMTFIIQLRFLGVIDRESFAAAFSESIERHPLLQAVLQVAKRNMVCWMPACDRLVKIDWAAEDVPITCAGGEFIDLTQEPGIRIWVRQGVERASVVFQFHHASCDGTGAYRFIGDLLAAYGIRTSAEGRPPTLGPSVPALLRLRTQRSVSVAAEQLNRSRYRAIKDAWRIAVRRPAPLASPHRHGAKDHSPPGFPGFLYASLNREEHLRLRDKAAGRGAMLNDLLLCALFLTIDEWNREHGRARAGSSLRIMMPTDMRGQSDFEMPAANMTSYTFLDRPASTCAQPDRLLQGIREETALLKNRRPGTQFMNLIALALGGRFGGLLRFLLRRELCLATAVLSNTSDPSRRFTATLPRKGGRIVSGNLILEEIVGVPPLRPKTRATFGISQYDRRLTVCLRCDPGLFSLEDTGSLLAVYMRHLQNAIP